MQTQSAKIEKNKISLNKISINKLFVKINTKTLSTHVFLFLFSNI